MISLILFFISISKKSSNSRTKHYFCWLMKVLCPISTSPSDALSVRSLKLSIRLLRKVPTICVLRPSPAAYGKRRRRFLRGGAPPLIHLLSKVLPASGLRTQALLETAKSSIFTLPLIIGSCIFYCPTLAHMRMSLFNYF